MYRFVDKISGKTMVFAPPSAMNHWLEYGYALVLDYNKIPKLYSDKEVVFWVE
jgi:hypothetical protein